MDESQHGYSPIVGLSVVENQVLREKAKGLSDLEVALRLRISERDVRAIAQRFRRRALNGKMVLPPGAVTRRLQPFIGRRPDSP